MIRFPELHIATSVVNRILNANRDILKAQAAPVGSAVPSVPDSAPLGAALDGAIAEPTAAVAGTDPLMAEDATTQTLFK